MEPKQTEEVISDLQMANEALADLKPHVTAADRKECSFLSGPTIVQYLNGQGTVLDTAVELLEFFRERINQRRRIIAGEVTK